MPCWYWDKKELDNSPSRKQGVTPENESRYRREGARFIYKLGQNMKLHHDTLASAAVFYHRFYQIHSFYKFRSRYVTATCCLFLAGKVEETPKKWTDLIKGARAILQPAQFAQFGSLEEAKDELMAMERVLLQTIKFDFNVEHAHKYIIQYCEELREDLQKSIDDEKVKEMVQQSWNFANDSYYTNLCLQWEPQIIAICMIYLAGKIQKVQALGYQTQWWEKFIPDLDRDLIESVCHQVLDIYSKPNAKKSAQTPGKGATPAKKPKLDDKSGTPSSEKAQIQEELKKLLSGVPQHALQTVIESQKNKPTPSKSTPSNKSAPPPQQINPVGNQQQQQHNIRPQFHTPQANKRSHSMSQAQWSTPQPPPPPHLNQHGNNMGQQNAWPQQQNDPQNNGGNYGGNYGRQNSYPGNRRGGGHHNNRGHNNW